MLSGRCTLEVTCINMTVFASRRSGAFETFQKRWKGRRQANR